MDILLDRVLVLNRTFFPLCVVSVKKALYQLFSEKAQILDGSWVGYTLEEWSSANYGRLDRAVRTTSKLFIAPDIIRLLEHDRIYNRGIHLTRQNVFLRDQHECVYCGSYENLTIDHVVPKSRAKALGLSDREVNSWTNWVTCCESCNRKKDDQTLEECGLVLRKKPRKPSTLTFGLKKHWKESWNNYLKDYDLKEKR